MKGPKSAQRAKWVLGMAFASAFARKIRRGAGAPSAVPVEARESCLATQVRARVGCNAECHAMECLQGFARVPCSDSEGGVMEVFPDQFYDLKPLPKDHIFPNGWGRP